MISCSSTEQADSSPRRHCGLPHGRSEACLWLCLPKQRGSSRRGLATKEPGCLLLGLLGLLHPKHRWRRGGGSPEDIVRRASTVLPGQARQAQLFERPVLILWHRRDCMIDKALTLSIGLIWLHKGLVRDGGTSGRSPTETTHTATEGRGGSVQPLSRRPESVRSGSAEGVGRRGGGSESRGRGSSEP